MLAPVFQTIATPQVRAFVGGDKPRIFGFGRAPEGIQRPYITYSTVGDDPYNTLSEAPGADASEVQIDCYAGPDDSGETEVEELARAVREALDLKLIPNRVVLAAREDDTKLFRIGLSADFITHR